MCGLIKTVIFVEYGLKKPPIIINVLLSGGVIPQTSSSHGRQIPRHTAQSKETTGIYHTGISEQGTLESCKKFVTLDKNSLEDFQKMVQSATKMLTTKGAMMPLNVTSVK